MTEGHKMAKIKKAELAELATAQAELNRRRTKAILEISVEEYFVARVEALGGVAEKTRAIGSRGYFDRVAVIPASAWRCESLDGAASSSKAVRDPCRVIFAELKRPKGGKLAEHQRQRQERYRAMGAEAVVLKSKEDVDALLGPA